MEETYKVAFNSIYIGLKCLGWCLLRSFVKGMVKLWEWAVNHKTACALIISLCANFYFGLAYMNKCAQLNHLGYAMSMTEKENDSLRMANIKYFTFDGKNYY